MRVLLLSLFVPLLGCVSTEDPGCVTDSECYAGRVCVDGRCMGDVPTNNVGVNNSSPMNNSTSLPDVGTRPDVGGPSNNTSDVGTDQNTVPDGELCMVNSECAEPLVCSGDYLEPDSLLFCEAPWSCEPVPIAGPSEACIMSFACEGDTRYALECEFGDRDDGVCACVGELGDILAEFSWPRFDCEPASVAEIANVHCRWQLPRF